MILCRRGKAEAALQRLREIMEQAEADGERGEDTDLQGAGRESSTSWDTRSGRMFSACRAGQARIGYR